MRMRKKSQENERVSGERTDNIVDMEDVEKWTLEKRDWKKEMHIETTEKEKDVQKCVRTSHDLKKADRGTV